MYSSPDPPGSWHVGVFQLSFWVNLIYLLLILVLRFLNVFFSLDGNKKLRETQNIQNNIKHDCFASFSAVSEVNGAFW